MSIESIKSVGMTYQAATSNTVTKKNTETVDKSAENKAAAQDIGAKTVDFKIQEPSNRNADSQEQNPQEEQRKASIEAIKKAVSEMNKQSNNKTVQFGVHEATNRMTIKILDASTRKVIKEFPAEESLDLIAKAWEMAGLMVDEKR
ncbi:MAG: flagellar protein FlaG [Lachnospiraceae bacterium]|jgi:flagellar protein FlaG|nr:flagellar protein FlaG [Lachnospiraceae bacterium]